MQIPETKWSKYYDPTKYNSDFDPNQTLYGVLKSSASKYGDRVAVEYGKTRITYKQLLASVDRVAASMINIGIKKGDIITLSHSGMPTSITPIYAASKIGAIVSVVNNALTGSRLKEIVEVSESKYFFVATWKIADFMEFFDGVEDDIYVLTVKYGEYANFQYYVAPRFHRYRMRDRNKDYKKLNPEHITVLDRPSFLVDKVEEMDVFDDYRATAIIFNSGSATGSPIPVEGSSMALNYKALATSYLTNLIRGDKPVRIMSCVKQSFSFGLTLTMHASIAMGDTMVLYADAGYTIPEREILLFKPDVLVGYPMVCTTLMDSRRYKNANLSFLKIYISAGESMSGLVTEEFRNFLASHKSSAQVYRLYGLTESLSAICYNPPEFNNDRILGIPLPGVNMKIMNRSTGTEMPVGEKGEICINYSGNMNGYFKNPEITAELMMTLADGKKWLFTGDYGREDENGVFTFEGHSKKVVDMGYVHVYPEIIENEIKNIFGVDECCVVPVGDVGSRSLTAIVVPIEDYITDNDKLEDLKVEIIDYCQKIFFKEMQPTKVEFRIYLPRKRDGEIDYYQLIEQMESRNIEE
ncbi:MAG: acyl--CoA ligase [Saccharofermentans sp.]|nr:acyl--CoA ligase [Saccharofermentans sp.]